MSRKKRFKSLVKPWDSSRSSYATVKLTHRQPVHTHTHTHSHTHSHIHASVSLNMGHKDHAEEKTITYIHLMHAAAAAAVHDHVGSLEFRSAELRSCGFAHISAKLPPLPDDSCNWKINMQVK